jgi:molecular chaperone HscB
MNYFEFYQLPIRFQIDAAALKKSFYSNSRKYHPDFYTAESAEKQAEVLQLSTLNNKAYKTLSDFDKRMEYVLQLLNALGKEGETKLPQDFLMEMMELNETLADLQFDFDAEKYQQILKEIKTIENQLLNEVKPLLETADALLLTYNEKKNVKNFYLKRRYLLRIQKTLSTFAAQ